MTRRILIPLALTTTLAAAALVWYRPGVPFGRVESPLVATPGSLEFQSDSEKPVRLTVTLKNPDAAAREIERIDAGCQCLRVVECPKQLAAHGSGRLIMEVEPPSVGKQEHVVKLVSGGRETAIPLVLRGKPLHPPFVLTTATTIERVTTETDAAFPYEFDCVERAGDAPWVESLTVQGDDVTVSGLEVVETTHFDEATVRRKYRVQIVARFPPASLLRSAILEPQVHSPSQKSLPTFPVSIRRQPSVTASPSDIVLNVSSQSAWPIEQEVRLVSARDEPLPSVEAKSSVPWLTVVDGPRSSGADSICRIRIDRPSTQATAMLEGSVTLTMSDASRLSAIEIPVFLRWVSPLDERRIVD